MKLSFSILPVMSLPNYIFALVFFWALCQCIPAYADISELKVCNKGPLDLDVTLVIVDGGRAKQKGWHVLNKGDCLFHSVLGETWVTASVNDRKGFQRYLDFGLMEYDNGVNVYLKAQLFCVRDEIMNRSKAASQLRICPDGERWAPFFHLLRGTFDEKVTRTVNLSSDYNLKYVTGDLPVWEENQNALAKKQSREINKQAAAYINAILTYPERKLQRINEGLNKQTVVRCNNDYVYFDPRQLQSTQFVNGCKAHRYGAPGGYTFVASAPDKESDVLVDRGTYCVGVMGNHSLQTEPGRLILREDVTPMKGVWFEEGALRFDRGGARRGCQVESYTKDAAELPTFEVSQMERIKKFGISGEWKGWAGKYNPNLKMHAAIHTKIIAQDDHFLASMYMKSTTGVVHSQGHALLRGEWNKTKKKIVFAPTGWIQKPSQHLGWSNTKLKHNDGWHEIEFPSFELRLSAKGGTLIGSTNGNGYVQLIRANEEDKPNYTSLLNEFPMEVSGSTASDLGRNNSSSSSAVVNVRERSEPLFVEFSELSVLSDPVIKYPVEAINPDLLEAEVVVEIDIDENGVVTFTRIVQRLPLNIFNRAAKQAAKGMRFEPHLVDGKPTSIRTTTTLNFTRKLAEAKLSKAKLKSQRIADMRWLKRQLKDFKRNNGDLNEKVFNGLGKAKKSVVLCHYAIDDRVVDTRAYWNPGFQVSKSTMDYLPSIRIFELLKAGKQISECPDKI